MCLFPVCAGQTVRHLATVVLKTSLCTERFLLCVHETLTAAGNSKLGSAVCCVYTYNMYGLVSGAFYNNQHLCKHCNAANVSYVTMPGMMRHLADL